MCAQECNLPSKEEIEQRKKEIKDTLRCPHCGERLKKWVVPQTPFTTWPNEYMYICFNDECSYLVRGREYMAQSGMCSMYRLMYDPLQDCCQPIPVPNTSALKDGIMEESEPCQSEAAVQEPEAREVSKESITGSWRLVAFEERTASGAPRLPLGPSLMGSLMYTPDGHISVQNMVEGMTQLPEDALKAAEVYGTFNGRYEIKRGGKILHHIDMSFTPGWGGTSLERTIRVEGNRLTLIGPPMEKDGKARRVYMVWVRAG